MNQSRYWREKNAELSAKNDALRQQLADVTHERDNFKAAYTEWSDKTDWVQRTANWSELGKHRADVMTDRLKASEALLLECISVFNAVSGFGDQQTRTAWYAERLHPTKDAVVAFLTQSAPAADEQRAGS